MATRNYVLEGGPDPLWTSQKQVSFGSWDI